MKRSHLLTLLAAGIMLAGCKKDSEEVDLGYGYFPRKVGAWIEYQVDSTWRDDVIGIEGAVNYRLLEKVVEQYTDPEGRTAWRIHRFVKDAEGLWVIRDVWTSTTDEIAAEVTEENDRMQKLSFPVRNGRRWDVNAYNPDDELLVAFREADKAWSGGGLSYERTVLVKNTVPPNFIETENYEERWAHGVGMVSRYRDHQNNQSTGCQGCWRLDMIAVDYGQE